MIDAPSDRTGAGADAFPNGFLLLLLPACRDCLGIPPASAGRRRRTGQRTSNTITIVIFITVLPSTPIPTSPCSRQKTKTTISHIHQRRRLPVRSRRRHSKRQSLRKMAGTERRPFAKLPGSYAFLHLNMAPAGADARARAFAAPQDGSTWYVLP
jgi:hypothetical protein